MKTFPAIALLVLAFSTNLIAQSGRRGTTSSSTPPAPIQPPLTSRTEPLPAAPLELRIIPERIMEREIRSIDSGAFKLADFHGKVVVINLWASWCGPCRHEIPEYEKVRKGYAGREVEFVGLTLEDPNSSTDRVHKFLREVSFGFRLGWADPELARTLKNGRNGVPQTIVIDGTGSVVNRWSGYAPGQSGDHLKEAIDVALDRPRAN